MRIVIATGGLGNTMFQYALVIAMRNKDKQNKSILFASPGNITDHNGYELQKVFKNVTPYKDTNILQYIYIKTLERLRCIKIKRNHFPHKILFCGRSSYYTKEGLVYYPDVFDNKYKNAYFWGQFQSYLYFDSFREDIISQFQFDERQCSQATTSMLDKINKSKSVSIHIRRGDYLTPYFIKGLGNICDNDYYCRCIEYIENKIENPTFYIFSDDLDYVRENIKIKNAFYIDFNKGQDSWQDMFLMSKCKHNIIANSTFSWWGAYLNTNKEKIVLAPKTWWRGLKDDIISPQWYRL